MLISNTFIEKCKKKTFLTPLQKANTVLSRLYTSKVSHLNVFHEFLTTERLPTFLH